MGLAGHRLWPDKHLSGAGVFLLQDLWWVAFTGPDFPTLWLESTRITVTDPRCFVLWDATSPEALRSRSHVSVTEALFVKLQRKDYTALTKFLPPKYEYVLEVRMTPIQCKLYQYYLDHLTGMFLQLSLRTTLMAFNKGRFATVGRWKSTSWTLYHALKCLDSKQIAF